MSSILKSIDKVAMSGKTKAYYYLWNNTAKRLRNYGFKVYQNPKVKTKMGVGYYKVKWEDAVVENLPDNWVLDEILSQRLETLTTAQVMWLKAHSQKKKKD